MNIMMVVTGLNRGGAERQVVHLATGMAGRGHHVSVVSLLAAGPLEGDLRNGGVEVRSLGMSRGSAGPSALASLRSAIRAMKVDVLHSHMFHATLLTRIANIGNARVPLVSTAHTIDEGGGWRPIISRLTHRLSAVDTNVTEAGVKAFEKNGSVPRGRMIVVPNGLPLTPMPRIVRDRRPGTPFRWLCVARSSHAKGVDILVRAFAFSRRLREEALLTVVGGGEQLEANRRLADELGVSGCIAFPGEESDPGFRYRAADAMVLPSRWEGLPMVVLEAGCHCIPVVATAVGGVPELLRDGAGILVDPGHPEVLAAGMLALMDADDEERALMGAALAERVARNHSIERVLDRWEQLYRRTVARTEGR